MHHVRFGLPDDAAQCRHGQRVRDRRMMRSASRVNTWHAHGHGRESAYLDPGGKDFLVEAPGYSLGGDNDVMTPVSENVREVKDMSFLPADVRGKELGRQYKTHY
jgi:hypothetical protein